uniref:NADH-ubiquinone oxidoreductase chain 3 n=1 Tax=Stygobromus foliatus TaxID=1678291 RepID=A0A172QHE6_9CRUS|nr:NADH dehydrogenase subunit 3 [Stygobromus foliatus]
MPSITLFFIAAFSISGILMSMALIIGAHRLKDRNDLMPYECGFDPQKSARLPFSLRFFLLSLIFLIFDVEVALILPLGASSHLVSPAILWVSAIFVILILILGLFYEWALGSLEWV